MNKYQLPLVDPRDGIVLQTELDDQCDKLAIDSRRYCQLSSQTTIQFITLRTSTFVELSSTKVDVRRVISLSWIVVGELS